MTMQSESRWTVMLVGVGIILSFLAGDAAAAEIESMQDVQQLEEMEITLRQWLGTKSNDRSARLQLATVLTRLHRRDDALAEYDILLEQYPDDPEIMLEKADALFKFGRHAQSLLLLRKLRRMGAEYDDIYRMRFKEWKRLQEQPPTAASPEAAEAEHVPKSSVSSAPAPVSENGPADVQSLLLRAAVHMRDKEYAEALSLYDRVLTIEPELRVARMESLRLLYLVGDYNRLISCAELMLAEEPDDVDVMIVLARTAAVMKQFNLSSRYYRRVLEIDPGNYEAKKGLGYVMHEQQKISATERKRDLGRAENMTNRERYRQAETIYEELLDEDARDHQAFLGLARARTGGGQYDEALKLYRRVLELKPGLLEAELGILDVLQLRGTYRQALEKARELIAGNAAPEALRRLIHEIITRLPELEAVVAYFEEQLEADPGDRGVRHVLAVAYRYQGRFKDAIELNETLLETEPENVEVLVDLGVMCNYVDRNKSAVCYLQRANRLAPARPDVRAMLFQLHSWYSRVDAEVAAIQKELLLDRNEVDRYLAVGRNTAWRRDVAPAREHYRKRLISKPDDTEALLGMGQVALYERKRAEAERYFNKVLEIPPDNSEAREGLAALAAVDDSDFDVRYRSREIKDYNSNRSAFDRHTLETGYLASVTRRNSRGDEYLFRYAGTERYQDYLPLSQREYDIKGNAFSLGYRRLKRENELVWLRVDANSYRNNISSRFNLNGTENQVSGFALAGRQYRQFYLWGAVKRDLLINPVANSTRLGISTADTVTLAGDVDARRDLSFLVAASHLVQNEVTPSRNMLRILARYRPSIRENIQLMGGVRTYTNPKQQQYQLSFDLRDKIKARLRYWLGYDVLFGSDRDTHVDTHTLGMLLDYDVNDRLGWFFDYDYSFQRRDDEDRETMYQTGFRFRL